MQIKYLSLFIVISVCFSTPVWADQTPEEILNAVIKIKATIPEDASTAQTLGTEREGNGVVIDASGHILTAGYGGFQAVLGSRVVSRKEFVGYWEYLLEDAIYTTPPYPNYGGAAF